MQQIDSIWICKHEKQCSNQNSCNTLQKHQQLLQILQQKVQIAKESNNESILYNPLDIDDQGTEAQIVYKSMCIALYHTLRGTLPVFVEGTHEPGYRFKILHNSTLAMVCSYLYKAYLDISYVWYHNPSITNDNGHTNLLSPKYWLPGFVDYSNSAFIKQYLSISSRRYPKQKAIRIDNVIQSLITQILPFQQDEEPMMEWFRQKLNTILHSIEKGLLIVFSFSAHNRFKFPSFENQTFAMIAAQEGYIVPKDSQLYHEPTITSDKGCTVCSILQSKEYNVPDYWQLSEETK